MCGICGFVGPRADPLLDRMLERLEHRGPDDVGRVTGEQASLGIRRLSIIDVEGGRQPARNETGDVAAVLNGEIYNYRELREMLGRRGHTFGSRSDTEVLPHLYEEFGVRMASLLRGMFALAIWDERESRLLLARDRAGEKPLLYAETPRGLSFASEMKALVCDPDVGDQLDPLAMRLYLTLQYVPGPRTILRDVRKLPPGHYMTVEPGRPPESRPYWDLVADAAYPGVRFDGAATTLRDLLGDAVRAQLHAERPVGALLSGGIDSAAIVAHMTREASGQPVRTFTVGFEGSEADERPAARRVATALGTEHTELAIKPPGPDDLERFVWHLDEPVGDQAALPTLEIVRAASEHVTVLLTGEGSDELLAGYPRYGWQRLAGRLPRIPAPLAAGAVGALGALRSGSRTRQADLLLTPRSPLERHVAWVEVFSTDAVTQLLDDGGDPDAALQEIEQLGAPWRHLPPAQAAMALDFKTWLPDNILTKADRMSMASSIEARAPFLDIALIEFAASLPASIRLHGRGTKALLRASLQGMLPPDVLGRRKRPFAVPVHEWLGARLGGHFRDLLLAGDARTGSLIDAGRVRSLLDRPSDPWTARQVWTLGVLELWLRSFRSGSAP